MTTQAPRNVLPVWPPEAPLSVLLWYLTNKGPCRAPLHRLRWCLTYDGHPQFQLGELVQLPTTRSRHRRKHSQGTGDVPTPATKPAPPATARK